MDEDIIEVQRRAEDNLQKKKKDQCHLIEDTSKQEQ